MSNPDKASSLPRLVHIAVRTKNLPTLAEFYKDVFEMKVVREGHGAIDLWDGNVFLAINPESRSGEKGLDHFGFLIDDLGIAKERLKEAGQMSEVTARPAGRSFADWRIHDLEGNPIDLSDRGYNTVPSDRLQKIGNGSAPQIHHLAIYSDQPSLLTEFYKTAFGMEVSNQSEKAIILTDGKVRLVLLSRQPESKRGLYCFGFQVSDGKGVFQRLRETRINISPEPDWEDTRKNQFRLLDPAGNLVTVSEMRPT